MLPTQDNSRRIGSLLFNTGGPGGVATIELQGNGTGLIPFSDEIRDRFDIVAMDPRGIGESDPILCDHTIYNELAGLTQFPTTEKELKALKKASQRFGQSCLDLTGPLAAHVDSQAVARDFEAVRLALGDEPLNYIGLSYGTVIGQAYLELFPDKIRTMVLDGDIDHTQAQSYLVLTEARTYENVLNQFFNWCDSDSYCALHNKSLKAADLWDRLIEEADRHPISAPGCSDPSSYCATEVTASDIIYKAQEGLVIQRPIPTAPLLEVLTWPVLAQALHKAYYKGDATYFSRTVASSNNASDSYVFPVVFRNDWNVSISNLAEMQNLMQLLSFTTPHTRGLCEFYQVAMQSIGWSGTPAYSEHVLQMKRPPATVLLVNAYYDPETSYDWAVALQDEIPGSVLLTRDGAGHTSYMLRGEAYDLINKIFAGSGGATSPNTIVKS